MTLQKKSPELVAASVEAHHVKFIRNNFINLPPRLKRLLRALLEGTEGLSREQVDRVTPCSNGPEYIRQLRSRLGLQIPCEMTPFVTIDGESSKYGIYRLTLADRRKLKAALN